MTLSSIITSSIYADYTIQGSSIVSSSPVMHVSDSTVKINGSLVLNGVDVGSFMEDLSSTLTIVKRDLKIEEKYPRLKELYNEYHTLLEHYKLLEEIKGSSSDY